MVGLPRDAQVGVNAALGMSCIPHLGQYAEEYNWLQPSMTMRCFPTREDAENKFVLDLLPANMVEFEDNNGNQAQRNLL